MLRIVMPTSFETELLDRLQAANHRYAGNDIAVAELYGSLPRSVTGSGRPERSLPKVDAAAFEQHVAEARRRGFAFTALFNSSCTANQEFDPAARRGFVDALLRVRDLGCRSIVVASPYLIDLAVRHTPELRVHVSSVAFLKSTKEARHYLKRGATRLILDPDTIRDFGFIRRLRRECPEAELEVLCNHPCLLNCPYETYCYNSVSHASTAGDDTPYEPFSLLRCHLDKLADTTEFVKGSWFRPQDIHHWEDHGVTAIKIAGRGRPTAWLARVAEAYLSRRYDGDMMDLVWDAQWNAVWRAADRKTAVDRPLRVDARAFDGFIEHFVTRAPDCRRGCGTCTHCGTFAQRGLTVDERLREESRDILGLTTRRLLEVEDA